MTPHDLRDFPALLSAWNSVATKKVVCGSHVEKLLDTRRMDGVEYGIQEVDRALSVLLKKYPMANLQEQVDALFGSEHNWQKATSELLGLSFFHERNLLMQTGWPPNSGKTPPFDGEILIAGVQLPFDVKSAAGSGLKWLKEALSPTVKNWASARGHANVDVEYWWEGVVSRQAIADHRNSLVEQLSKELPERGELPAAVSLSVDKTTICITLREGTGAKAHGGVVGVKSHADSILETLRKHVEEKGEQAATHENTPFFIAYVRPSGCGGSDMSGHAMEEALRALNRTVGGVAADLWLGTLSLDWTPKGGDPVICEGLLRPDAKWPQALSVQVFADEVGVTQWPLTLT